MIAKDMMPWLFVSRKSLWTPFAKVRNEAQTYANASRRRGGVKTRKAKATLAF
jgi:hypothetical protein